MTFITGQMGDALAKHPDLIDVVSNHDRHESRHEQGQDGQVISRIAALTDGPGLRNDVGEIGGPHPAPHEQHLSLIHI